MASHSTLLTSEAYAALLARISDRLVDLELGLDPADTTVTAQHTGAKRFNSANKRWEEWNGTAWVEMSASYAITIDGMQPTARPSIRPTLNLDFANRKTLDPRITFTRASTAMYFDANGVMRTAAINEPRFTHDPATGESLGLMIEEQRTNLLTYSEDFSHGLWVKALSTITVDAMTAPDGALTGDKFVETAVAGLHQLYQTTTTSAGAHTFSAFAKQGERSWLQMTVTTSGAGAYFDLANGAIGTIDAGVAAEIEDCGNGVYRCSVRATLSAGTNYSVAQLATGNGVNNYTGDGTSGLYIWGAQLEAGSDASSYIQTTSAAVTRSADMASMTGANFSDWYRQDEGTFYAESANVAHPVCVHDTTPYDPFIRFSTGDFHVFNSGTYQAALAFSVASGKSAGAYKTNDFAASTNGAAVLTDTSGSVPTNMAQLWIGSYQTLGAVLSAGTIKSIRYYPKRLTNSELQALTQS